MNKFKYLDYKALLLDQIKTGPKQGRGLNSQLAKHLGVHTTFLTHVLRGGSHFSSEQALKVCDFFSFSELETDFFVQLVNWNRAGDQRTRDFFYKKLEVLQLEGLSLKEQLRKENKLSVDEQAVFYSDWTYSAVRLASALPNGGSIESIAKILELPYPKVSRIVDFLLKMGLCKHEGGRLTYGAFSTYVGSDSPFAKRLHDNWRMRSIAAGSSNPEDLMFTSIVTLTKADFLAIRELLLEALKKFEKVTDESDPQQLAYLTVDWIKIV